MTEPLALARAAVVAEQADAQASLAVLRDFSIENDDDQAFAAELLLEVKARHTALDEKRKTITGPMNVALRNVNGLFKPALDALLGCERELKGHITGYLARKEAANRAALAAAAASATEEQATQAMAIVSESAPMAGVRVSKVWVFEVINVDLVPAEYWSVDMAKIMEAMRESIARDGEPEPIPGVRFSQEDRLAASRGAR